MKKFAILIILSFFLTAALFAQKKYALVIGNGTYTNFGTLRNPVNDANDVAAALQSLGWTVDKVLNGSLAQMENAAIRLKNRLVEGGNTSYGFFFYAGHGVQMDGINYLIPADANIPDRNFLRERALSVQVMLGMLNDARNALNIVVLDACRDFPVAWTKSADRGLAVIAAPPADSIIMYATGAGKTASDGTGKNGLFTTYLLANMKNPDLEVNEVFRRTMGDVQRASNNEQRPALYTDFSETAYLGSKPKVTTTTTTQPQQPATQPAQTVTPAAQQPASIPAGMVRIQGGTFTMGSPSSEPSRNSNEGPQHQVTVSSFYMGRYEVTQKEYQEVMGTNPSNFKGDNLPVEQVSWYDAIEYCNKRSQKEGLTPAYTRNGDNVTWNKNANGYRLPTEAEWEYACRAGTTTPFSTGNNVTTSQANYDGNYPYNNNAKGEYRQKTTAVGSFSPNALGLYDMHGNVREWCWDWYGDYTSGAQTDPMGASSGSYRVLRGGNWNNYGMFLRSASRYGSYPYVRYYDIGFRLVRP
ncbi:serine/threonine protein kinase [Treponema sp. R8-4-B8]